MAATTRNVILVDDEALVLESLRNLLALETTYKVHVFTSAQSALEAIPELDVDVVVSDFLMPGMNGIEFLKQLRKLHPAAPRILLTGYADKESAIRAINEIALFQYIEKPWHNDQLLLVLKNAMERKSLLDLLQSRAEEIEARSEELQGLRDEILRTLV